VPDDLDSKLHANRVRLERPRWLETLSDALDAPVREDHLLSIDETADLKERTAARLRDASPVRQWSAAEVDDLHATLRRLAQRVHGASLYLLDMSRAEHQAAHLNAAAALGRAERLAPLVHDLVLVSADAGDGIVVERNHEPEEVFELFLWGRFEEMWESV